MEMFLALGAILAALGVVLGAFGAHALKDKFASPHYVAIWETAVQYQMYHALGILALGILSNDAFLGSSSLLSWAGYLMFTGIVFFSGSLYVLAVTGVKKLGAITPIGGMLFIIAWVLVIIAALS
ncbi:hypothetical protein BFZC1_02467 [Lysinibacillus fusiformis ZC1]|uniref:DUF423 domain-containing protein n=1 Tax=Lysinibacillus capsici TaxID=2115968 RepID=UPI0001DA5365|nr:DUF423 domain-containing protein [Lysinibacillus capsici]EFI70248.1 hypothetical protein BFZC1_02467 [Lysinibacillus fusiformis ZC1]EKU44866.1 hypothetical protein C518_0472 [Lysinibacillus fusiformis ZB2]MBU5253653.1 DUF423 domain-containing protein [Lysinibacillus capsici]